MLHVTQIFKQPMPDGRLATAVRCTEESSMRMDPREVAAQLDRLCGALASGALSLDALGAPLLFSCVFLCVVFLFGFDFVFNFVFDSDLVLIGKHEPIPAARL